LDWSRLVRKCLLNHVIEAKREGAGREVGTRKQLLDDPEETRRSWKVKQEAVDHTVWRTGFGRGYGPVARQTTE